MLCHLLPPTPLSGRFRPILFLVLECGKPALPREGPPPRHLHPKSGCSVLQVCRELEG